MDIADFVNGNNSQENQELIPRLEQGKTGIETLLSMALEDWNKNDYKSYLNQLFKTLPSQQKDDFKLRWEKAQGCSPEDFMKDPDNYKGGYVVQYDPYSPRWVALKIVNKKVQPNVKPPEAFWSTISSEWIITKSKTKKKQERAEFWKTISTYKPVKQKQTRVEKEESKRSANANQGGLQKYLITSSNVSSLANMTADQYKQFDGKTRTASLHKDRLIKLGTEAIQSNIKHLQTYQDEAPRAVAVLKKIMTMMVHLNHPQEQATKIINANPETFCQNACGLIRSTKHHKGSVKPDYAAYLKRNQGVAKQPIPYTSEQWDTLTAELQGTYQSTQTVDDWSMFGDYSCVKKDRWQQLWIKRGNEDRLRKYVASCISLFFTEIGLLPANAFGRNGENYFVERMKIQRYEKFATMQYARTVMYLLDIKTLIGEMDPRFCQQCSQFMSYKDVGKNKRTLIPHCGGPIDGAETMLGCFVPEPIAHCDYCDMTFGVKEPDYLAYAIHMLESHLLSETDRNEFKGTHYKAYANMVARGLQGSSRMQDVANVGVLNLASARGQIKAGKIKQIINSKQMPELHDPTRRFAGHPKFRTGSVFRKVHDNALEVVLSHISLDGKAITMSQKRPCTFAGYKQFAGLMNNNTPLDAEAEDSNMNAAFAKIDIVCYDNTTESWAFHMRKVGDSIQSLHQGTKRQHSLDYSFRMFKQLITKNVLTMGRRWNYGYSQANLDLVFNSLDMEKRANSWVVEPNYGQTYPILEPGMHIPQEHELAGQRWNNDANTKDIHINSGAIIWFLSWWKMLLGLKVDDCQAFYTHNEEPRTWLQTMLEKYNFTWMLETPHVKKWITNESKIRTRVFELHHIEQWLDTEPGSEPLNCKAIDSGFPQMLYNKDDHYLTHNNQNQHWIQLHYKKNTLSIVQYGGEGQFVNNIQNASYAAMHELLKQAPEQNCPTAAELVGKTLTKHLGLTLAYRSPKTIAQVKEQCIAVSFVLRVMFHDAIVSCFHKNDEVNDMLYFLQLATKFSEVYTIENQYQPVYSDLLVTCVRNCELTTLENFQCVVEHILAGKQWERTRTLAIDSRPKALAYLHSLNFEYKEATNFETLWLDNVNKHSQALLEEQDQDAENQLQQSQDNSIQLQLFNQPSKTSICRTGVTVMPKPSQTFKKLLGLSNNKALPKPNEDQWIWLQKNNYYVIPHQSELNVSDEFYYNMQFLPLLDIKLPDALTGTDWRDFQNDIQKVGKGYTSTLHPDFSQWMNSMKKDAQIYRSMCNEHNSQYPFHQAALTVAFDSAKMYQPHYWLTTPSAPAPFPVFQFPIYKLLKAAIGLPKHCEFDDFDSAPNWSVIDHSVTALYEEVQKARYLLGIDYKDTNPKNTLMMMAREINVPVPVGHNEDSYATYTLAEFQNLMVNSKMYFETSGEKELIWYTIDDIIRLQMNVMSLGFLYIVYKSELVRTPQVEHYGKFIQSDSVNCEAPTDENGLAIQERFDNSASNIYKECPQWQQEGWKKKELVPSQEDFIIPNTVDVGGYEKGLKRDVRYTNQSIVNLSDLEFLNISRSTNRHIHYEKLPTYQWIENSRNKLQEERKQPVFLKPTNNKKKDQWKRASITFNFKPQPIQIVENPYSPTKIEDQTTNNQTPTRDNFGEIEWIMDKIKHGRSHELDHDLATSQLERWIRDNSNHPKCKNVEAVWMNLNFHKKVDLIGGHINENTFTHT